MEQHERVVYELLDLGYGYCRMVVATRDGDHFADEPERRLGAVRIATKYPRIAARYFESSGRQAEVIEVKGSVELAPISGLADGIVDLTATGTHAAREPPRGARGDRGLHRAAGREPRLAQAAPGGGDRRARDADRGRRRELGTSRCSRATRRRRRVAEAMRGRWSPRAPSTATSRRSSTRCARAATRALLELTLRFDSESGRRGPSACRPRAGCAAAPRSRSPEVRAGARRRDRQRRSGWRRRELRETLDRGHAAGPAGRRSRELPVRRAGAYVPGGRAAVSLLRRDVLR